MVSMPRDLLRDDVESPSHPSHRETPPLIHFRPILPCLDVSIGEIGEDCILNYTKEIHKKISYLRAQNLQDIPKCDKILDTYYSTTSPAMEWIDEENDAADYNQSEDVILKKQWESINDNDSDVCRLAPRFRYRNPYDQDLVHHLAEEDKRALVEISQTWSSLTQDESSSLDSEENDFEPVQEKEECVDNCGNRDDNASPTAYFLDAMRISVSDECDEFQEISDDDKAASFEDKLIATMSEPFSALYDQVKLDGGTLPTLLESPQSSSCAEEYFANLTLEVRDLGNSMSTEEYFANLTLEVKDANARLNNNPTRGFQNGDIRFPFDEEYV